MYQHQSDETYHKFGRMSVNAESDDYYGNKVLYKDMSNISTSRKRIFFPSLQGHFTTDNIINGTYRVWDNGIIEFDLIFRVGYQYTDQDGNQVLSCNNVTFRQSIGDNDSSTDYQRNTMYFNNNNDMSIFTNQKGMKISESRIGKLIQGNRNDYVNTYFAELKLFQHPMTLPNGTTIRRFKNLDYMIFSDDLVTCDINNTYNTLENNQNTMVYCNKTTDSITAVYVTTPKNGNTDDFGSNGGISTNTFGCHIIGQWGI